MLNTRQDIPPIELISPTNLSDEDAPHAPHASPCEENKASKWTLAEDEKLKSLVNTYGNKKWKIISENLPNRNPLQCLHRWTKILQPGLIKGPWTIQEDDKLYRWVETHGAKKWSLCAEIVYGRSGKQCRERWFNTLNPNVIKGNWTEEEDYLIFKFFAEYGSKWSKISSNFKGRTENSIKNRVYSTLRRIKAQHAEYSQNNCNLEELVKYLAQALEEKRKAYISNLQENEKEIGSITDNKDNYSFLNRKRKIFSSVVDKDKSKLRQLQLSQESECVLKDITCNNNSSTSTTLISSLGKANANFTSNTENVGLIIGEGGHDYTSLFSQLNELQNILFTTKNEIQRFDNMKSMFHNIYNYNFSFNHGSAAHNNSN